MMAVLCIRKGAFLRFVALVLILGFAIAVGTSGSHPAPAQAATSGIQYDQLVQLLLGNQGTPQPGSFETDYQAAIDAQKSAANQPKSHGLFGGITNTLNAAKNAMNVFKTGTPTTEYYLNGMERVDDPGDQTATITKPQQHQVIVLNLATKTYQIVDTSAQPITETPPPYQRPPGPSGTPVPSQPGTMKLKVTVSTTDLGSKVLGGVNTEGYRLDFKLVGTEAKGSCSNGSFETSMIVYDSSYPQPKLASSGAAAVPHHAPAAPNPETANFKPGCKPTVTARTHMGPTPPADRLSMWEYLALSASMAGSQGSGSGSFSTLIQRGNVKTLGPADASLFAIPPGFTQVVPSPSP